MGRSVVVMPWMVSEGVPGVTGVLSPGQHRRLKNVATPMAGARAPGWASLTAFQRPGAGTFPVGRPDNPSTKAAFVRHERSSRKRLGRAVFPELVPTASAITQALNDLIKLGYVALPLRSADAPGVLGR